ncbi:TPA: tyrosine-type recombinase/integrase [Vibrio parahaemolyticus]
MANSNSTKTLTSLTLNSIKPGECVSDSGEYRGLRVSCGKSGVKTFIYRYRSPSTGKIKQYKIGRYRSSKLKESEGSDLLSLAEARVKFLELKALRDSGVCPVEQKQLRKVADEQLKAKQELEQSLNLFTVQKLVENYVSDCIEGVRTKKAASECRRSLYGDPVKFLGDMPAAEVTSKHVFDMCMGIVERGANVQAGFILRELTAAFDHAIDNELPEDHTNPCYQAKGRLKRKRIRLTSQRGTRVLNDGELSAFLKWLPGARFTPGQKGVLHFTLMTGCRTGEACEMRWDDVNLETGVWHLRKTKTGVARNVQLSTQAIAFLEQQRRMSSEYVFSQVTGNPVQQKTISERMWRMRKNDWLLDIEAWTPHDLRRTVRTGLARMGCPSEVAEAVLGHAAKGIEGVYNLHRYEQECRVWLQQWCDHLDVLSNTEKVVALEVSNG